MNRAVDAVVGALVTALIWACLVSGAVALVVAWVHTGTISPDVAIATWLGWVESVLGWLT